MAETIKTITDRGQFEEIFLKFFKNREVFIKTKSGDLFIQFLGYNDGNVAFRIPRVKNVPDSIVALTRLGDNTIYASLKVLDSNEDTFTFLPVKFQIISEKRKEERTDLGQPEQGQSDGKNILFVTGLMSEAMLQHSLESNSKKIEMVKDKIASDLKGKFDRTKVVFFNETRIDPRMKYFRETWSPLFIRDFSDNASDKMNKDLRFYLSEIYSKDYKLAAQKELISEAAVPFIYKGMIPYGYIQVNSSKTMDDSHLSVVKRLAALINEHLVKDQIFIPSKDRFLVIDVSKKGLGIVFKDRRQLRYFVKDNRLVLEMSLPDSNKVAMTVIVRNTIFHESGSIKVGLEISNIDAISEVNYDEFLEDMKK
ncbi:MAG TPA: hypothetical protein PK307_07215 [Spirochaetota bacterium]|mgnify:CR=1 FL=1|nr:hypothetical protein [Spirochaetota bacterium]HOD16802.1 hypothetical protein [Spirochaetota bacterium]HPG50562.1 hypothetical protein [Spirochaetota bacterium]HQL81974.1 hypothetical protein [Spirochaetota bacterium]